MRVESKLAILNRTISYLKKNINRIECINLTLQQYDIIHQSNGSFAIPSLPETLTIIFKYKNENKKRKR